MKIQFFHGFPTTTVLTSAIFISLLQLIHIIHVNAGHPNRRKFYFLSVEAVGWNTIQNHRFTLSSGQQKQAE